MIREIPVGQTRLAWAAMRELRETAADESAFVEAVDGAQRPEGYRIAGAFEDGREEAAGVAGFRTMRCLAWGHTLYIDDLSTLPGARRHGHGAALLAWCAEEAGRLGCDQLHLDSGVGLDRADAHRLYMNSGLVISAHHFARRIP